MLGLTGRGVAGLLVVTTCVACGATPDEAREDAVEETGLVLYLPEVPGAEPTETTVVEGRVETQYETDGLYAFTLVQQPAPDGDLCEALLAPDHQGSCETDHGVMRETFEEMSSVAVVRGGTVLVVRNLVTEVAPGLIDRVALALQAAPEVEASDLAGP